MQNIFGIYMMDFGSQTDFQNNWCILNTVLCWVSVFSSRASSDESSSDETSNQSSPTVRKRRAKKRLISSSETEGGSPAAPESEPPREEQHKRQFSSGLNRCIVLALVIAISMGFGHFYGEFTEHKIHRINILLNKYHFMWDFFFFLVVC